MKTLNRFTGRIAEDIAARTLSEKGYTILKRNFANRFGEIDIIARDKDTLVFVEVKAKTGIEFGLPEEMVGRGKLQRIRTMATLYMKGRPFVCRIDVIAIVLGPDNELVRLTHYENVY
jgi:putative endonuclease